MKKLILTRHAKSSWNDPMATDHARVLNGRGRENATAMGHWLKAQGYLPDAVLCSTAERAVQTWEGMGLAMESTAAITYETALYHASADQLLAQMRKMEAETVILVAHNPGIGDFADRLAKSRHDHEAFFRYPTCATTVFQLDIPNWSELRFGIGDILAFQIPREL